MQKRVRVLIVVVLMMVTTTVAFASGGHGDGHHHFDWMGFFGKVFNSTVLFGGLVILLRKPIIDLLARKSLETKNDIIQREEDLGKTSSQLEDIQKRLEKIEEEVTSMKEAAEAGGEEEKKRIEELGKQEAQRILELTEAEIDTRVENSIRGLKARIADLTISHFKKDIETKLNKKSHEKIIDKNIEICGDIIERE